MTGTTTAYPDAPSGRAIENLIATYAFLVDDGEFAKLGDLLAEADFSLNGGPVIRGRDAIEKFAHETLRTYEDGTPRTRHVTTNIIIETDEQAGTAVSRSYYTVFQSLPDFPLQAIASGRTRTASSASTGSGASPSGPSPPASPAT